MNNTISKEPNYDIFKGWHDKRYEKWNGPQYKLIQIFQESVDEKYDKDVCLSNICKLIPLIKEEYFCMNKLLNEFREHEDLGKESKELEGSIMELRKCFEKALKIAGKNHNSMSDSFDLLSEIVRSFSDISA